MLPLQRKINKNGGLTAPIITKTMKNAQFNTKQDLTSNITNIGNGFTINEFVDAGFNLIDTNEITTEEFKAIMHEALAHLQNTKTGA